MDIPLVDLKAQYDPIKEEVRQSIAHTLEGMNLFLGESVQGFEQEFAKFCGAKFGVGVGSGTEALHLALIALEIGAGAEVITVSHTFIATSEAISHVGAKPVFVDIDPKTYTMDISQVESRITSKTRAIIPVHLYGQPTDMEPLLQIAQKYDLRVIEDACQAHGTEYRGKRVGALGDVSSFSFYFSKNLGAYGEAGMVVTNEAATAEKIRQLRNHGEERRNAHSIIGYNSRMDELQAGILRIKLRWLEEWNRQRRQNAYLYNKLLQNCATVTPYEADYGMHVYHLYVIRCGHRDRLRQRLNSQGIQTGIHYPVPVHLQQAFKMCGYRRGDLPVTEQIAQEILSLPMYPELTVEQIEYVAEAIKASL